MFWRMSIINQKLSVMVKRLTHSSLGISLVPILILILVGVGTLGYALLEGWSLPDALYAAIITITTVGYGDFSPQTFLADGFLLFSLP